MRQRTFRWLSKYLKCRDKYYTELNGMPTGVSLFVWLPEERAKRDRTIRAMFGQ
ncbi:hypothetical protein [Mycobacterium sp.]|uniref:hypothetical protein n=1 Tax=Mycobacterium sp. TaxID=1785 RepID=UPI003C70ACF6